MRIHAGSLLLCTVLAACNSTQATRADRSTQFLPAEGLEAAQPADVAVAEVRNQTNLENVPLGDLRTAFSDGLVQRLYSPLDTEYVDANWGEASYTGATPPDAFLVVAITQWDPSHLQSKGVLYAAAELRLFEGQNAAGSLLWGVALKRAIDLNPKLSDNPPGFTRDLLPDAIRSFAREALELLPERDPIAAPR